jgi:hypothetical protein
MAATHSPATVLNLLKKAKKAYQKNEPEPKEEAEFRHTKIVHGLTRLRKFASKKDDAAQKPFAKEKQALLKEMKEHFKKLKAGQKEDPNKAQLPKYLKKFTALMIAVEKLQLQTLEEGEEDVNLEDLPDQELSAAELDALAADEDDTTSEDTDEFEARYNDLLAAFPADLQRLRAVDADAATTIQKLVTGASEKADQGDFKGGFHFLDQATTAIARALSAARVKEATTVIPEGKVAQMRDLFARAGVSWDATLEEARVRMRPVQADLEAEFPDAADGVNSILDGYCHELLGVLQTGQAVQREGDIDTVVQEALAKLQALRAVVAGDKLFAYLEGCGLKIKDVFNVTFNEVEALLRG